MKMSMILVVFINGVATLANIYGLKYFNEILIDSQIYSDQIYIYSISLILSTITGMSCGNLLLKFEQSVNLNGILNSVTKLFVPCILIGVLISLLFPNNSIFIILCTYLLTIEHIHKSELVRRKKAIISSLYTLLGISLFWMGTYFNFKYNASFDLVLFVIVTSIFMNAAINISVNSNGTLEKSKLSAIGLKDFINQVKYSVASNIVGYFPQIAIINLLKASDDEVFVRYVFYMYIFRAILFVPSIIQRISVTYLNEKTDKRRFIYNQQLTIGIASLLLVLFFLILPKALLTDLTFNMKLDVLAYIITASIFAAVSSPVGTYLLSIGNYVLALQYNSAYAVIYMSFVLAGLHNLSLSYIFFCMAISYIIHFLIGQYLVRTL